MECILVQGDLSEGDQNTWHCTIRLWKKKTEETIKPEGQNAPKNPQKI